MVTHGGWRAAEEGGHFGTGLGETEDVVHEEEHVLVFLVAEILGHGEGGEGNAETGTGGLVHLAVNQGHLGAGSEDGAAFVIDLDMSFVVLLGGDNAGLDHFPIKIVPFPGTFTHPGEDGVTAVAFGDVVNEFHDDDRLADARTPEGSDFTTLGEGADQVDDLDAGFEDLRGWVLVSEGRSFAVNRITLVGFGWVLVINRISGDVEDTSEDAFADWDRNRGAGVGD